VNLKGDIPVKKEKYNPSLFPLKVPQKEKKKRVDREIRGGKE